MHSSEPVIGVYWGYETRERSKNISSQGVWEKDTREIRAKYPLPNFHFYADSDIKKKKTHSAWIAVKEGLRGKETESGEIRALFGEREKVRGGEKKLFCCLLSLSSSNVNV